VPLLTTMDRLVAEPLATPKLNSILLMVFAGAIALLAAIGLYGLLAAGVRARRWELAVRLALGADAQMVSRLVLRQGAAVFAVGGAVGVCLAALGSRAISGEFYGVKPGDPLTLGLALLLAGAIVGLASWVPARRASRINPSDVLRGD
jgi:putative ABC transport system permease protein